MPGLVLNKGIIFFLHGLFPVIITKCIIKSRGFSCRCEKTIVNGAMNINFWMMYTFLQSPTRSWWSWCRLRCRIRCRGRSKDRGIYHKGEDPDIV
jgi:hypothetical protein